MLTSTSLAFSWLLGWEKYPSLLYHNFSLRNSFESLWILNWKASQFNISLFHLLKNSFESLWILDQMTSQLNISLFHFCVWFCQLINTNRYISCVKYSLILTLSEVFWLSFVREKEISEKTFYSCYCDLNDGDLFPNLLWTTLMDI